VPNGKMNIQTSETTHNIKGSERNLIKNKSKIRLPIIAAKKIWCVRLVIVIILKWSSHPIR
jgi:hypothetical protein